MPPPPVPPPLPIVNVTGAESPPPGDGEKTVTCAVPVTATSEARTEARNSVALTKVVVRSAPFQRTTDVDRKPVPVTVNVNAADPAAIEDGVVLVTAGAGLAAAATVTVGLVAARVKPLFGNSRNSYVPGALGIATVHAFVVAPAPRKMYAM